MNTKNQSKPNNDFLDDDLLSEFLIVDKDYTYKRQIAFLEYEKSFNKYLKPNPPVNIFMSFKENYLKFAHLVTKNAFVATIIMLLALTTVSASAAQLFAPEEYKPSTLINNLNKNEKESEPILNKVEPLVADSENEVIVLEKCDLAIKIPKKYHPELTTKLSSNLDFAREISQLEPIPSQKALESFVIEAKEQQYSEYYVRRITCVEGDDYDLDKVPEQVKNNLIKETLDYNFIIEPI